MKQPLHVQVEELLKLRLRMLRPGDRLPPEPQLATELGVSRTTLRLALSRIEQAGLVERRPGGGTVVTRPRFDLPLGGAATIRQAASASGIDLTPRLEGVDLLAAAEGPVELSQSPKQLLWLRRTYLAGRDPVAREELWLTDPDVVKLRELILFDPTASVYEYLALTGRRPYWSEEAIRSDVPTEREQALFGVKPILRLRRTSGNGGTTEVRELALGAKVELLTKWGEETQGRLIQGSDARSSSVVRRG